MEIEKNNPDALLNIVKDKEEKEKKQEDLKDFILDSSQLPQRIDHAVGFIEIGNKKYRYYGSKISQRIEKEKKNGEIISLIKFSVPCLILENGKIISEYKTPVNFEFDSVMTLKNGRWDLDSINQFCNDKINPEDISFKMVFEKFKEFYKKSMVFEKEEWYELNPLWDLSTYFWDLLDKFLVIKHEGISGSAKSKGMKISANLSFNGKKFLCPTPSNFFRYRHHNKATIFIEEAERLFDDSKKSNNDSELVEYLNGSYEKGNTVPRQNDKNINQTDEFDPAGYTRIGSIKSLKGALEKRSAPLHMIIANPKDKRSNVEIPPANDRDYSEARNLAYLNGLLNYKEFLDALQNVKNNYGLENRQWAVAKPLIALASCIDSSLEDRMGKFITNLFEKRDDIFSESSWEIVLSKLLLKFYCVTQNEIFIPTETLRSSFESEVNSYGGSYKISPTKAGILMSNLGFSEFKANPSGNQRGYKIDFLKLCEILIRQKWINLNFILKEVSEVSRCQFTEEEINKWYSDTFLTPDTCNKNKENNKNKGDSQGVRKKQEFTHKSDTLTPLTPVSEVGYKKNIDFSKSGIKEALEGSQNG